MKKERINIKTIKEMERVLSACADETRLKIMLALLDEGECSCCCGENCNCGKCKSLSCMVERSVSEIVEETKCSQSLVSHQLKVLKDLDLVKARKEGLRVYYSIIDGHIKELLNLLKEHVEER